MQKSSSLIEMKQMIDATSKSGSALQLGKKQGYFGVTLHEAMEMQKEKFPNLLIPVIMPKLTEAILLFGGKYHARVRSERGQPCFVIRASSLLIRSALKAP